MNPSSNWQRVSRHKPCPICERPDWCLISADSTAAICARVESQRRAGEAGYLHRLRDDHDFRLRPRIRTISMKPAAPITRFDDLAVQFRRAADPRRLNDLSVQLGLSVDSLDALGIGWSRDHGAWTFPMVDAAGRVLGIRLRRPNGSKLAVTGSREGLFIPSITPNGDMLLICEGATDTAALTDFGFTNIVGRPSCTGGIRHTVDLVKVRKPRHVVIVADGDAPGQRGADNLAAVLLAYVPSLQLITPSHGNKDVRAWRKAGGTYADLMALVDAAPVRRLTIRSTSKAR